MSSAHAGCKHHQWPRDPAQVEVDLDMLHVPILNGVGGEVDSADIVTVASATPLATARNSTSTLKRETTF
jgi:hypothetical protein